ncbi:hypothetical protein N9I98_01135 [Flavobacteriales bacterium]|jgi:hypothetical protein|nr:hypothetical protein [Flavobacteriales bacterium]
MFRLIYILLTLLEIPFVILTWLDYYLNLLCKNLSRISFIFALPSIVTWPFSFINGMVLSSIIYMRYNVIGEKMSFAEAIEKNLSRFPSL